MASRSKGEDQHLTPRQDLVEHAALAVLRQAAAGLPGMPAWLAGRVQKEPVRVYDINGALLFLDYAIARGSDVFGYVRTAASQIVGAPVVAIEMGPRSWNFDAAVRRLKPRVKKEFPKATLSEPLLVCYSYPKLGVMFTVQDESKTRLIYDVADLARISERPERPDNEGSFAWSFYEAISNDDRRTRLRRFKAADDKRLQIASRVRADLVSARALESAASRVAVRFSRTTTKLLQFCSHYAYNAARGHHCFSLHGQQVDDYCAVATCQMILCYYRYYFTQDQIAPACGYTAGNGCPADQSPGYESMSCNHIDASFDNAPTWQKARDQIDALHPFKSGITGHARACAGYSRTVFTFGGTTEEKLYIYDPWPWNANFALAGTVTWEDWDSIAHTNYVYTRINCP